MIKIIPRQNQKAQKSPVTFTGLFERDQRRMDVDADIMSESGVLGFKLFHKVDQRLHAFQRHRIIDGSAHATHRTVTFQ